MSISPEDFEYYGKNKSKLVDALINKSMVVDQHNQPGFVGLLNQGATCYLNSLLQCLFNDTAFRSAIFAADGGSSPIVAEIQNLFANLQLSECSAISTKDLSTAFGWEKSQIFEQHDVHELLSVLVDALGATSQGIRTSLSSLFQGSIKDVLTCPSCQNRSENNSSFLTLSLDLPDNLEAVDLEEGGVLSSSPGILLSDLLAAVVKPEVLDVDNKWECSGCNTKVQATKTQEVSGLPSRLFLHLKRFRFDPTTRRRRKLTSAVLFPQTLDAHSILKCGASEPAQYQLSTVLLHSGTALGGHYRAYTKTAGQWRECNDAAVTALTAEDESNLFWYDPNSVALNDTQDVLKRKGLYESAYMLVYERASSSAEPVVPASLTSRVQAVNEELRELRRLLRVQKQLVEITVHFQLRGKSGSVLAETGELASEDTHKCVLHLLGTATLADAVQAAFGELEKTGMRTASETVELSRLRRYNAVTNRVGETYGGREAVSLTELALNNSTMLLERRKADDPPFIEFNPREMQIRLVLWDSSTASATASAMVVVPGEDAATVSALRVEAAAAWNVDSSSLSRIVLIINNDRTVIELNDDSKQLKKDFSIYPGDEIMVDILPAGAAADVVSPALIELRNRKKTVHIFFNNPSEEGAVAAASNRNSTYCATYEQSVETLLDSSLAEVKGLIASVLGISASSFHTRRNAAAPQLKDESKTLHELGIVDQSILHLQLGPGCKIGEHMLRFELDNDSGAELSISAEAETVPELVSLGDLAIREKITVLQLKETILANWAAFAASVKREAGADLPPAPPTADHIRLRDGKNTQASGPLRNDRILSRCLMGLQDGRRIVIQILSIPEIIGPDDLLLSVRVASYENKVLSRQFDVPMVRSTTVKDLYTFILAKLPKLNEEPPAATAEGSGGGELDGAAADAAPAPADPSDEAVEGADAITTPPPPESHFIAIAKGFSTGPPLTLKSALKLKWNDPAVLCRGESTIDHPPLNLRDGSLLVVRGIADFERAKAAVKARREAEGPRPASAGTGAAAVKAKRPNSRSTGRFPSSLPKEKGLRIGSGPEGSGEAPPPPQPSSPEKA